MDDIFKNIRIRISDEEINNITKKMSGLEKAISAAQEQGVSDKAIKRWNKLSNAAEKMFLSKEKSLKTDKQIEKYYDKKIKQEYRALKLQQIKEKHPFLTKNVEGTMTKMANKIVGFFRSIWTGIMGNIKEMFSEKGVASYNMGTSLFTNANARQMSMKYGLGAGQTYALDQSMKMLGMQSDEDLMYMNTAQKEKFNELMTKYSAWYDKMEASGFLQNVQEAQLELKMFKQEVAMKFMDWFAQNKDVIMGVIKGTLTVLEGIANAVFAVLKLFGVGKSASTSSALSSEQLNNTTNNSNNMSINNTVNANVTTTNQADAQNFGRDVADGSIRLYGQMIKAL